MYVIFEGLSSWKPAFRKDQYQLALCGFVWVYFRMSTIFPFTEYISNICCNYSATVYFDLHSVRQKHIQHPIFDVKELDTQRLGTLVNY